MDFGTPLLGWIFDFDTRGQLRAGLFVSLVSVWLLVGVFAYLNYYTRRRYFSIWTAAWLFYALYLTISYSLYLTYGRFDPQLWWATMLKQWCISTAAVFMLWGGARFLGRRVRQMSLGLFLLFLLGWSLVANYPGLLRQSPSGQVNRLALELPIFALIGGSSMVTVWGFFRYRRKRKYMGAGLLCFGFILWGLFVAAYPFMEQMSDYMSTAFFGASVLQMFIAVNMIILVLEQIRFQREKQAAMQLRSKEKEKALLQHRIILTEERYRLLFEQSSEPIIITAPEDLHIIGINAAAARVLGVSTEEARQCSLFQWLPDGQAAAAMPAAGLAWFDSLCHERIRTIRRKEGSEARIEVAGSAVDFAGATAFQFYIREVSERSSLEQRLRQSEKLSGLGQMLSGVVHELNNPLAGVCGFVEVSLQHPQLPELVGSYLANALQEARRAARLLHNFLRLARTGGPEREAVDLNEILRNVIELRSSDFRKSQVQLTEDLAPQLPVVVASLDQVQQIVIILLNNALQAMESAPRPRKLRLSSREQSNRVVLTVEDTGPGVPVDLRARIFEPFFTTKPAGVGTGLGLSLAHTFAMEHHGRVWCDDSPLGGARFIVELPLPASAAAEPAAGEVRAAAVANPAPAAAPRVAGVLAAALSGNGGSGVHPAPAGALLEACVAGNPASAK